MSLITTINASPVVFTTSFFLLHTSQTSQPHKEQKAKTLKLLNHQPHYFCGDGSESSGEIPYGGIFWGFVVLMSQRLLSTLLAPTSHTNPGTIPIAMCYIVTAWTVLTNYTMRPKLGESVNK
jgi:hypothetical protein